MSTIEVKVPDIGDFKDVPVIELLVKPGDSVKAEDSLVTLESDKATMDVPSPSAGKVKDLKVKLGDKVSEGSVLLTLDADGAGGQAKPPSAPSSQRTSTAPAPSSQPGAAAKPAAPAGDGGAAQATVVDVKVPDIGDFKDVPVIEVLVKAGDEVKPEDALVTLESDKATMDVPSPSGGRIKELKVKVGDKVSEGSVILTLEAPGASATQQTKEAPRAAAPPATPAPAPGASQPSARTERETRTSPRPPEEASGTKVDGERFKNAHASPSVRAFARQLNVDLTRIKGTGLKDRIVQEDVQNYVKQMMAGAGSAGPAATGTGAALGLLPWPQVDFAKFGPVESKALSRIKKISGANLHRNWVMIPHVTNHDDADITDLEAFRVKLNKENEKSGTKVTMLAFLIKASVSALKKFPEFNASLDGDNLIYKKYYHIGFAADTPNGLVVPVIKNADQKGVLAIAKEMGELSAKAREGKLGPADMQGGCFSISSLGGIGGTYFTPIINAPEVAILGVCRSSTRPVWDGKQFAPRLILPLSLSWDHRVIDGASAARFNSYLIALLGDMRRSML
jgi:pyruvate dehydrogenase E2 component (dihydrolipoamide acetyltransferase)